MANVSEIPMEIKLDNKSLKVLEEFSESARQLFDHNNRLVDAENRISALENLLLTSNPSNEEEYKWLLDQIARKIFGMKYPNFVVIKDKSGFAWSTGKKP